jgi:hypothetical protein
MEHQPDNTFLGAKLVSAWFAVGISSWSDFAAFCAAGYTIMLGAHFLWVHGLRQFFVNRGLLKPLTPVEKQAVEQEKKEEDNELPL